MPNNYITIPLGLQEEFSVLESTTLEEELLIWIQKALPYGVCPGCGHATNKTHQITPRKVQDLPIQGKKVTLIILKRRFFCSNCDKPFTESFQSIARRGRRTKRLEETIYQQGKTTSMSLKELSATSKIKYSTVRRLWYRLANQELREKKPAYPDVMGVDEFSVTKGHQYHTVLTDISRHRVFDAVAGRDTQPLAKRLEEIPEDKRPTIFVVDLWKAFIKAIKQVCPKANIVADKFHVVRLINVACDKTRRMVQRSRKRGQRWMVYASRHLLLTAKENLTEEKKARLDKVVSANWLLGEAYDLKETLRDIYRIENYEEACGALKSWCDLALTSGLPAFKDIAETILRWFGPVTNYFKYRLTNGYTEGINNKIKLDKRIAYGYRNFSNQRIRILSKCA